MCIVAKRPDGLRCHLVRRWASAQATLCSMGTQLLPEKRHTNRNPIFGPCLLWRNGWIDQDMPLGTEVNAGPGKVVLDGVAAPLKGAQPQLFGSCLLWPDGWMDEDTTWYEVDLGPGHVVLDGVPALRKKRHSPSLFSANVYCGHGRLSQLLLSSSIIFPTISCPNVIPYAN